MISDNLEALTNQQKTAVLFSFFSKELLIAIEYWFKVNIDIKQKVDEVMEAMKTHLKRQRLIFLARHNLFTHRQQQCETLEDW